jgi:cyclic pyranopterin monophosphate synthase
MKQLSHYDASGAPCMVDVSAKPPTRRTARAHAFVRISAEALAALPSNPKGDVLEVARIAGIQAAKRTWELIPLCHPLPLTYAGVDARIEAGGVRIEAEASATGPTGVEMEALTAATVAALTVYDMIKALDRAASIEQVYVTRKKGGKSGTYRRKETS